MGAATFYAQFRLQPIGKYLIMLCKGTACHVNGADAIGDVLSGELGIEDGGTTEDGLFTLDALRCIGACGIAPAVTISGTVYPKMSVDKVAPIIEEYKKKAEEGAA